MTTQIVDNFLPDSAFKYLQSIFLSWKMPWEFQSDITGKETGIDQYQFVHLFYHSRPGYLLSTEGLKTANSDSINLGILEPLIKTLNPYILLRVKANLRPRTHEPIQSEWHTDLEAIDYSGYKTAVYYLNTNNGYTLFEDGTKVNSVGNRVVMFDGNKEHCGISCTDQQTRVVLNLNYLLKK